MKCEPVASSNHCPPLLNLNISIRSTLNVFKKTDIYRTFRRMCHIHDMATMHPPAASFLLLEHLRGEEVQMLWISGSQTQGWRREKTRRQKLENYPEQDFAVSGGSVSL